MRQSSSLAGASSETPLAIKAGRGVSSELYRSLAAFERATCGSALLRSRISPRVQVLQFVIYVGDPTLQCAHQGDGIGVHFRVCSFPTHNRATLPASSC